jgi:DNA polymerase elongation subunit (family B)
MNEQDEKTDADAKFEAIEVPDSNDPENPFQFRYYQNEPGILPGLLSELAGKRKAVRAEMAKTEDKGKRLILDKRQLAIKVSMNSVYGFTAAQTLPCLPIGASVTSTGRRMILATKEYLEKHYPGTQVIYGGKFIRNLCFPG